MTVPTGMPRIFRHVRGGLVKVEVEHDDGPLVDVQIAQMSRQSVTIDDRRRWVTGVTGPLVDQHAQLDHVPASFLPGGPIA